jgi:hypothetical protein
MTSGQIIESPYKRPDGENRVKAYLEGQVINQIRLKYAVGIFSKRRTFEMIQAKI